MTRLHNGQSFPSLDVPAIGGGTIRILQSLQGAYGVVLIYRGAWCPYCQTQPAGFERASRKLAGVGIKVVALSVDDEATTAGTVEKHKLSFPVGHSADPTMWRPSPAAYTNDILHYHPTPRHRPGSEILHGVPPPAPGRQHQWRRPNPAGGAAMRQAHAAAGMMTPAAVAPADSVVGSSHDAAIVL